MRIFESKVPEIAHNDIPFAHGQLAFDENVKQRFKKIVEFIENENWMGDRTYQTSGATYLDIGDRSALINEIEKKLGITADSTNATDFNNCVTAPKDKYDNIFCFEVLEHVMNPALFMRQLRELLNDNGVLYLSTPKASIINFYQYKHHFAEYRTQQLIALFEYCGFMVKRVKIYKSFPFKCYFKGIRIAIRTVFYRTHLFELRVK